MPGSELPNSGSPASGLPVSGSPKAILPDSDLPLPGLPSQVERDQIIPSHAVPDPNPSTSYEILALSERADPLADPSVLAFLRSHQTRPVEVDASRLRMPNGPLVETLVVAAMAWRARGIAFRIAGLAPAHVAQLHWLGLAAPLGLSPAAEVRPA